MTTEDVTVQASEKAFGFLSAALRKLSSEVLIFLLAYAVLMVVFAMPGVQLGFVGQLLVILIPILGVSAYLLVKRRDVDAQIKIRAREVSREALVIAERGGDASVAPAKTDMKMGKVTDRGQVIGRDLAPAAATTNESLLLNLFRSMDSEQQQKLIKQAAILGP